MSTPTDMNEYLFFFRGPDWDAGLTVEQTGELLDRMTAWVNNMHEQGRIKGGQVLGRGGKRVSGSQALVSDGPFAETKEEVGGYLALLAKDMDEAVALAREWPTLAHGITIEVREVQDECPITKRIRERRKALAAA
jgi:hypothetical protein